MRQKSSNNFLLNEILNKIDIVNKKSNQIVFLFLNIFSLDFVNCKKTKLKTFDLSGRIILVMTKK